MNSLLLRCGAAVFWVELCLGVSLATVLNQNLGTFQFSLRRLYTLLPRIGLDYLTRTDTTDRTFLLTAISSLCVVIIEQTFF